MRPERDILIGPQDFETRLEGTFDAAEASGVMPQERAFPSATRDTCLGITIRLQAGES